MIYVGRNLVVLGHILEVAVVVNTEGPRDPKAIQGTLGLSVEGAARALEHLGCVPKARGPHPLIIVRCAVGDFGLS